MSKKAIVALLMVAPAILLASHGGETTQYFAMTGRETDFIPRIFNFLVFFGLLYYLIATLVKNFFKGRRDGIATQLNEIESKLQEAKEARKNAEQAVVDSRKKAKEILADSQKEAELLRKKIAETNERDLEVLAKQYEEKMELEERKMARETIDAVLNENITSDDIPLAEEKVVDIIAKKVA